MTSWRPYVISALVVIAGFGLWRISAGASSDPELGVPVEWIL
jgi:hypothetical protein